MKRKAKNPHASALGKLGGAAPHARRGLQGASAETLAAVSRAGVSARKRTAAGRRNRQN